MSTRPVLLVPQRGMPAAPVDPRTISPIRPPAVAPPPSPRVGLTEQISDRIPRALHVQPGDGRLSAIAPVYADMPEVDLLLPHPIPWEGLQTSPLIGVNDDDGDSGLAPGAEGGGEDELDPDDIDHVAEVAASGQPRVARYPEYARPHHVAEAGRPTLLPDPGGMPTLRGKVASAPHAEGHGGMHGADTHAHDPYHHEQHLAHDGGTDPHLAMYQEAHDDAGNVDADVDRDIADRMDNEDATTADKDLALWRRWRASGKTPETRDPVLLEELIARLKPLTQRKLRSYKRTRVISAGIEQESRRRLVDSLNTFDPSKSKLSTYVINGQQRVLRFVQQRANSARITEGRIGKIGDYKRAISHLEDEQGYTPTPEQVAKYMKLPLKTVLKLGQENHKDHIASASPVADPFLDESPEFREILQLLPPSLNKDQLTVFEYTQGINGKPKVTSTGEIAKLTGWSPAKVSQVRTQLANIIDRYR